MSASTSPTLSPLAAEAACYNQIIPATAPWFARGAERADLAHRGS